jgi:hypothetical protein
MLEILLYKAKLCIKKLNETNTIVSFELVDLDARAAATQVAINDAFDEILAVIEERRELLMKELDRMSNQKRAVLLDQSGGNKARKSSSRGGS